MAFIVLKFAPRHGQSAQTSGSSLMYGLIEWPTQTEHKTITLFFIDFSHIKECFLSDAVKTKAEFTTCISTLGKNVFTPSATVRQKAADPSRQSRSAARIHSSYCIQKEFARCLPPSSTAASSRACSAPPKCVKSFPSAPGPRSGSTPKPRLPRRRANSA